MGYYTHRNINSEPYCLFLICTAKIRPFFGSSKFFSKKIQKSCAICAFCCIFMLHSIVFASLSATKRQKRGIRKRFLTNRATITCLTGTTRANKGMGKAVRTEIISIFANRTNNT